MNNTLEMCKNGCGYCEECCKNGAICTHVEPVTQKDRQHYADKTFGEMVYEIKRLNLKIRQQAEIILDLTSIVEENKMEKELNK